MPHTAHHGTPRAHVLHRSPGRLRLRLPGHRHDGAFLHRLSERLERIPGVESVQPSAETGTLLIRHHADFANLMDHARKEAIFVVSQEASGLRKLSRAMDGAVGALDQWLRRNTDDELDLSMLLSFVFLVAAAGQMARGEFRRSGLQLLLFAVNAAARSNKAAESEELSELEELA